MSMSMETMTGHLPTNEAEAPRCRFCGCSLPIVHNPFTGDPIAYGACNCKASRTLKAEEKAKEQIKAEKRAEEKLMKKAKLPKKFWGAVARIKELLTYEIPAKDGEGLYIFGAVGTGKTETVCALARKELRRGKRVRYINEPLFFGEMKARYAEAHPEQSAEALVQDAVTVDVLIIDDIGKTKPTTFAVETLYRIIEGRYAENLTTMVTSNFTLEQLQGALGRQGEADKAAAICSRLREMCRPVFSGRVDHRAQGGQSPVAAVTG